ncbi:MAG: flagellar biosynthesis protein FlhB [Chromatiales bacterium]
MAEQHDGQERTERATPKRLEEAKRRGQVARSRELTTMALLLASGSAMLLAGNGVTQSLAEMMRSLFTLPTPELLAAQSMPDLFLQAMVNSLLDLMPLLLVTAVVAILIPLAVGGGVWSGEALGLKWERLDPIAGLKRMFGLQGLAELAKSLAKLLLVTAVLVGLLWHYIDALMYLDRMEARAGFTQALRLTGRCFLILAAATIVVAAFDVPWQLWSHARRLRMSKQEVREELKETEGKPEVRTKIRRLQQAVATRRMMEEVPKADVIVTTPAHYAVALRYVPEKMAAPRVIAKGLDELARQIMKVGAHHKVMTFSAPPLARAIYHSTRIGREVPTGLYVAVARVLAYVFQLKAGPTAKYVQPPTDLPIPEVLRRDA